MVINVLKALQLNSYPVYYQVQVRFSFKAKFEECQKMEFFSDQFKGENYSIHCFRLLFVFVLWSRNTPCLILPRLGLDRFGCRSMRCCKVSSDESQQIPQKGITRDLKEKNNKLQTTHKLTLRVKELKTHKCHFRIAFCFM